MEKVLEMKPCKECGKLFVPKHKLSLYCDDIHYRPCPVCGKLVIAKYLSDPARCCSGKCKAELGGRHKFNKVADNVAAVAVDVDEFITSEEVSTEDSVTIEPAVDEVNPENVIDPLTLPRKQYVGKDAEGFISGHTYHVNVDAADGVYNIFAHYDVTDDKKVELSLTINSKSTYYKKFKSVN